MQPWSTNDPEPLQLLAHSHWQAEKVAESQQSAATGVVAMAARERRIETENCMVIWKCGVWA